MTAAGLALSACLPGSRSVRASAPIGGGFRSPDCAVLRNPEGRSPDVAGKLIRITDACAA
jgi:hypothetical protein